jgi:hypothetical protein
MQEQERSDYLRSKFLKSVKPKRVLTPFNWFVRENAAAFNGQFSSSTLINLRDRFAQLTDAQRQVKRSAYTRSARARARS